MKARPKEMLKAMMLADEIHTLLVTKMVLQKGNSLDLPLELTKENLKVVMKAMMMVLHSVISKEMMMVVMKETTMDETKELSEMARVL